MFNHRKLLALIASVFLALPLLYVLSSGPVLRLAAQDRLSRDRAMSFYEPLVYQFTSPLFRTPFHAYLALWHVHLMRFYVSQIEFWILEDAA